MWLEYDLHVCNKKIPVTLFARFLSYDKSTTFQIPDPARFHSVLFHHLCILVVRHRPRGDGDHYVSILRCPVVLMYKCLSAQSLACTTHISTQAAVMVGRRHRNLHIPNRGAPPYQSRHHLHHCSALLLWCRFVLFACKSPFLAFLAAHSLSLGK